MRWSGLTGFCAFLLATQAMVGCGDEEDRTEPTAGSGGKAGSGGSTAGSGGSSAGKGGSGGNGGSAGSSTAGKGGSDTAGSAGMAGTGGTPECTVDTSCDDSDPCTDDKCTDGKCQHTDNTATCDDGNECTSDDKCDAGACKGTNNTADCDDLSACTAGQDKCADGKCGGTKDETLCPKCDVEGNLIKNCDFSDGLTSWAAIINNGGGNGTQTVINERNVIEIISGGANTYEVQPRQEGLTLKQGMKYKLRMLAGASIDRSITVSLTKAVAPYAIYSDGGSVYGGFDLQLTQEMKPFEREFVMNGAVEVANGPASGDDTNVKLEVKVGKRSDPGDANHPNVDGSTVYFDDVYLVEMKCDSDSFCDDENPCTTDACDLDKGTCSWTPVAEGDACTDDEQSCTKDECVAGACVHTPLDDDAACESDGDDCTIDACTAGECKHTFDDMTCNCTMDSQCDDNNPCTDDTCDNQACVNTPNADACSDNNACTSGDVCTAGTCVGTNNTDACDDGDVCTVNNMCSAGACDPGTDVCFDCTAGGNLIKNCNFDAGLADWTPGFYGGTGTAGVENGMMKIVITDPGTATYMVQPLQPDLVLTENVKYTVKFNAYSSVARTAVYSLTQNGPDYISYSGQQTINLTTEMQLFTSEFTMGKAPDVKVKFEFDLGNAGANTVYIDNVFIAPAPL